MVRPLSATTAGAGHTPGRARGSPSSWLALPAAITPSERDIVTGPFGSFQIHGAVVRHPSGLPAPARATVFLSGSAGRCCGLTSATMCTSYGSFPATRPAGPFLLAAQHAQDGVIQHFALHMCSLA